MLTTPQVSYTRSNVTAFAVTDFLLKEVNNHFEFFVNRGEERELSNRHVAVLSESLVVVIKKGE